MEEHLTQEVAMLKKQLDEEGTDYSWVEEDYEGDFASQTFILRGMLLDREMDRFIALPYT